MPFAAVIKIVLREAGAPRRRRMAELRGDDPDARPVPAGEPQPDAGSRGGETPVDAVTPPA